MDAIKGTMTELYSDLSKNTSGNTLAEVGEEFLSLAQTFILQSHVVVFFTTDKTVED